MKITVTMLILLVCTAILTAQEAAYPYSQEPAFHPGDQSMLVFPTAYTMPQGSYSLTSYMIMILQFTYSVTNSTHLTVASLFPVTTESFKTITPGIKQRYLKAGKYQAAAIVSYNFHIQAGHLGNVISYGEPEKSLHLGVNALYSFKDDDVPIIIYLGGRRDVSAKISLLAELASTTEVIQEEFDGIMTMGVRFRGETISWELGGFRPIRASGADILLFPFLKATVLF